MYETSVSQSIFCWPAHHSRYIGFFLHALGFEYRGIHVLIKKKFSWNTCAHILCSYALYMCVRVCVCIKFLFPERSGHLLLGILVS